MGSVVRVLEILSGPCVEARVRQSALTQLSVMTEDSRLHQIFIEQHGIEMFTDLLKNVGVFSLVFLFSMIYCIILKLYNNTMLILKLQQAWQYPLWYVSVASVLYSAIAKLSKKGYIYWLLSCDCVYWVLSKGVQFGTFLDLRG